jgi:4-amino-4-deoxy-L-arabinose transferase-like glycosyltransferase
MQQAHTRVVSFLWNWKILFATIIILAAFLRLWQLGTVPAGLHADETAYGYNAYSLLLTGKDEYGEPFPLVLKSFGEYKPALYAYLIIPALTIFDLTSFSVRLPSALFGVLSVILLYFLVNKLLKNQPIALLASFLLAISPWHLNLSRTTSEVVVSVCFMLLLVYALSFVKEKFSIWWISIAIISGVFAIGSYTASRFFVVLISVLFTLFSLKFSHKKVRVNVQLLFLCILFIGMGLFLSVLDRANRFNQISIFANPETKLVLEEQIREDQFTPPLFTRAFHNKIVNYTRTALTNYDTYFSLDYLFLSGGKPPRMVIPESGLFYLWQLPFLLIGLYVIVRKRTSVGLFLLSWWLILLLPAAVTFDEIPNVYRSLIILPPVLIIIALGVYELFAYRVLTRTAQTVLLLLVCLIGLWEFAYYQHQLYKHQKVHQPWSRAYAYQPLVETLDALAPRYNKIVVTKSHSNPYIFFLFYTKYDPKTYQSAGSVGDTHGAGFANYQFTKLECPLQRSTDRKKEVSGEEGVLYINKGTCETPGTNAKLVDTITWQDGSPAFKLLEYVPSNNVR